MSTLSRTLLLLPVSLLRSRYIKHWRQRFRFLSVKDSSDSGRRGLFVEEFSRFFLSLLFLFLKLKFWLSKKQWLVSLRQRSTAKTAIKSPGSRVGLFMLQMQCHDFNLRVSATIWKSSNWTCSSIKHIPYLKD